MPAMIPIYDSSGLVTDYSTGITNYSTGQTGRLSDTILNGKKGKYVNGIWQDTPPVTPATSTTPAAPLANSGQSDLTSWLQTNIPGYGGANPTTPATPAASNFGAFPSYTAPKTSTATAGGTIASRSVGNPSPFTPAASAPAPSPGTSGLPELPSYAQPAPAPLTPSDPTLDPLTKKSLANISSGLSGQLPQDVVQQLTQRGSERGISVGSNSPNAGASMLRAMGLTSLDLQQAAEKNLQPYQERSAAVNLANISNQNQNYRAILDAASAMQRLQLSESGQMARLTSQESSDLQQTVLKGQQSLQQISAQGNTSIALAMINANADQQRQILAGSQAMQQLQLSESGKIAQLSSQEKVDLQKQVTAGEQALAQINAQGLISTRNANIAGSYDLQKAAIDSATSRVNANTAANSKLDQVIANYSNQQQNQQQQDALYNQGYDAAMAGG